MRVDFVDLTRQYASLREEILAAFDRVSSSGTFVLGAELEAFETEFAALCGRAHGIGVGNGSDALYLALRALGIGPGDEVITAANSFVATAWVIDRTGAKIVFADVGDDMNLDPTGVADRVTERTAAILPVHLTGRVADMDALGAIARRHGLALVEDAAQAVGARRGGRVAGSFGHAAGFSLHPLKNLHVHGDGGIVVTEDADLAARMRAERNHGLVDRDHCAFWGINSRLDPVQAAIARVKLEHLEKWTARQREIAARYRSELAGVVAVPSEGQDEAPVYHRFMVRHPERDRLRAHLASRGVGSAVNYPIPLHLQPAAAGLGYRPGDLPVAERLAATILSLPCYAELRDEEVDAVIAAVRSFG